MESTNLVDYGSVEPASRSKEQRNRDQTLVEQFPGGRGQTIPRVALLAALRLVGDDVGGPPSKSEFERLGAYSLTPYENNFPSWNAAKRVAGYTDIRSSPRSWVPDEDLVDDLLAVTDVLGRPPRTREYKERGTYSSETIRLRFGGWFNALNEAGLTRDIEATAPRWIQTGDLIDEMVDLAADVGHPPSSRK